MRLYPTDEQVQKLWQSVGPCVLFITRRLRKLQKQVS
ncbi:MAG: helix-turn-helix domain-containing protein [Culicoidibacterales bacterium]